MVNVKVNGLSAVQGKLIDLPKQVRFAEMQAINDTAKAVQQYEIDTVLPGNLTLRGSGWWKPGTRFGINIRPFATKANLRAVVGSQANWLQLVETGGTKTATGHRLAIEAGARPSETAVLPRNVKPRALLNSRNRRGGKGFIIQTKSGPAIFIREGGTLKLMYMLEQSANIHPILKFFIMGEAFVQEIYQKIFDIRLKNAIATAK